MSPSIAVIIPNINSPILDRVLAAVESQGGTENLREILVIGRDDYGLISTSRHAHLLETNGPVFPGTARNIGIKTANAEVIYNVEVYDVPGICTDNGALILK